MRYAVVNHPRQREVKPYGSSLPRCAKCMGWLLSGESVQLHRECALAALVTSTPQDRPLKRVSSVMRTWEKGGAR